MTELQKKELEILDAFIDVCSRLELKWFMVCGSALGAVKYGGFIPWDDDIDIGLFRDDYEIFVKEAGKYLPSHLFLQNYHTEPQYPSVYSKLRHLGTAFIEKNSENLDINHGVFIDIFPLDGYPDDEKAQKKLERKKLICRIKQIASFEGEYSFKMRVLRRVMRFFGVHKRAGKNSEQFEKIISAHPVQGSRIICNHGNWQGKLEYSPVEHYGNGATKAFEGRTVLVPERFDEYFTQKYGNWQSDLPAEKQKSHHLCSVIDVNRSYLDYVKK